MIPTKQTEFTELLVRHNGEYCRVLWEPLKQDSYQLMIISSYGNWAYYFSTGGGSFAGWLANLNTDYLGNKLMGEHFRVFDAKASFDSVRDQIEWEDAVDFNNRSEDDDWSADAFLHLLDSQDIDTCEAIRRKPCDTWTSFWRYLWMPAVIPALLEVAAAEEIAA